MIRVYVKHENHDGIGELLGDFNADELHFLATSILQNGIDFW